MAVNEDAAIIPGWPPPWLQIKEGEPMPTLMEQVVDQCKRELACDNVNHPAHYTAGAIECIDVLEQLAADGVDFRVLNAVQYCWRAHRKGGVEDLKKAIFYLSRVVAQSEGP